MCKSKLMNESALWDKIGGLASVGQQLGADQSKFIPTNHFQYAIHFYIWSSLKVPLDILYLLSHSLL